MKKILITMSSGRLGTGIINALKAIDEPYYIIGLDSNPIHFLLANVDEKHLVPRIDDENFYPVVRQIIEETEPDFFWPLHDDEMPVFAGMNDLGVPMLLPSTEAFELTQDKMVSYEHFKKHGVPVPDTVFVNDENDLKEALERFHGDMWLRAYRGAGSKGAFRASNLEDAIAWVNLNRGWGSFTAAERITGPDAVLETLWYNGDLIFAQGRTRRRGTPGTVDPGRRYRRASNAAAPSAVLDVGLQAIRSVMPEPHGIFFADQKIDDKGLPRVTEVNTGRFSTNGVVYWHDVSVNVPGLVVKLGLGEDPGIDPPLINPIPADLYRISGDNFPCAYIKKNAGEPLESALAKRIAALRG